MLPDEKTEHSITTPCIYTEFTHLNMSDGFTK